MVGVRDHDNLRAGKHSHEPMNVGHEVVVGTHENGQGGSNSPAILFAHHAKTPQQGRELARLLRAIRWHLTLLESLSLSCEIRERLSRGHAGSSEDN